MKAIIVQLLGEYTPKVYEDGTPMGGLASLDYEWIVGAVCFVVGLIGVILLIRTLMNKLF